MIPEKYLRMFASLRTDKNRKLWTALTCHQAPHKPFVLLSVMDLIVQGQITKNFVETSLELVETFNLYWIRAGYSPLRPRGRGGVFDFFVHREIPIDEKTPQS